MNEDMPWVIGLTQQEVDELRVKKRELSAYAKEKLSKMKETFQMPNGDYIKPHPNVTRVEVITNNGREFVRYDCSDVQVSLQDDGRTFKVFLGPSAKVTDRKKELHFVISEWWDTVFQRPKRLDKEEEVSKLVEQIIELEEPEEL